MRFVSWLGALLLLIAILFSGCTQFSVGQGAPQTGGGTVTKFVCADGTTIVNDITSCPPSAGAPRELTEEEKAIKVCVGMPTIQQNSFEDVCIIGVAGKYKNISLCMEVSRDQRLLCYAVVAEVKNDPDVCKEAESMVDQCYDRYATDKKDSAICNKITEVGMKDSCYDKLANQLGEPTLCNNIMTVGQKDNCFMNMASRFGNATYCENITNSDQKQNCLNNTQRPAQPK